MGYSHSKLFERMFLFHVTRPTSHFLNQKRTCFLSSEQNGTCCKVSARDRAKETNHKPSFIAHNTATICPPSGSLGCKESKPHKGMLTPTTYTLNLKPRISNPAAQVVANHLWLDLNVDVLLAIVDTHNAANHLGHDDHVALANTA